MNKIVVNIVCLLTVLFFVMGCKTGVDKEGKKDMELDALVSNRVNIGMEESRLIEFFREEGFSFTFQEIDTVFIKGEGLEEDIPVSLLRGKYVGIYNNPISRGVLGYSYYQVHVLVSITEVVVYYRTEVVSGV